MQYLDPVDAFDAYTTGVLDGRIPACVNVRRAVERHHRWMAEASTSAGEYQFDVPTLRRVIGFCRLLRHQKGRWGGQPFDPAPWQVFVLGSVFCWVHKETGLRRIREAFVFIPRKNGKSMLAAAVSLYCLLCDGEPGAEVYSAATKLEQAREVFDMGKAMAMANPQILKRLNRPTKSNLSVPGTMSKFAPLGRDYTTMDGKNPHLYVIDEWHAHKDRGVFEVLASGEGAREQPLGFVITTAGSNLYAPCKEDCDHHAQVLDPQSDVEDDTLFAYLAGLDDGDDPFTEASWRKANPNYGVSVLEDGLRIAAQKARRTSSAEADFKTKRVNMWVGAAERWLSLEEWDQCPATVPRDREAFRGQAAFAGLDLASTRDLAALAVVMPHWSPGASGLYVHFWCPEETARVRSREDRVPYLDWSRRGLLTMTPGNSIDYDYIRQDILELANLLDLQGLGYDPHNATQLVHELDAKGVPLVLVRQGFVTLSAPSKELDRLIACGSIDHGGNPIMRWQASHCTTEIDAAGNIKPSKKRSREKIDGIAATVTALAVAGVPTEDEDWGSAIIVPD